MLEYMSLLMSLRIIIVSNALLMLTTTIIVRSGSWLLHYPHLDQILQPHTQLRQNDFIPDNAE